MLKFLKRLWRSLDWDVNESCGCGFWVACGRHSTEMDALDEALRREGR